MGENVTNYKLNATSLYRAMCSAIDKAIADFTVQKNKTEEIDAKLKRDIEAKEKKINGYEAQIRLQEELKEKLTVAFDYLSNPKLEQVAKIEQCISNLRDSLVTGEEVIDENEHRKLSDNILALHEIFKKETTFTKEIDKYGNELKKYIKDHRLNKEGFYTKVNGRDQEKTIDWGSEKLITNILLSIYSQRDEIKEEIDDPVYSSVIKENLEIIKHYREMVESERIEAVDAIKTKSSLFSKTIKSEDETGEIELKQADEYYKIRTAISTLMLMINEYDLTEEYSKTVEKLKHINQFCTSRFDNLIVKFEKSNFSKVKSVVLIELKKDKYENDIKELNEKFNHAYRKIGKEHERLLKEANAFAKENNITESISHRIEMSAKEDALRQLMLDKKISSVDDLKNILDSSEFEQAGTTVNWRSNEVLSDTDIKKGEVLSQREFEEEVRRRRETRRAMNNYSKDESEQNEIKQNQFEEFMSLRKNGDYSKDNVVSFEIPKKRKEENKETYTKDEILRKAVSELVDKEGKEQVQIDYEIDELVEAYKETVGMTSDERAFHILKVEGKIEEETLEEVLQKSYMKIILEAQKRDQVQIENLLLNNDNIIQFENNSDLELPSIKLNRM